MAQRERPIVVITIQDQAVCLTLFRVLGEALEFSRHEPSAIVCGPLQVPRMDNAVHGVVFNCQGWGSDHGIEFVDGEELEG